MGGENKDDYEDTVGCGELTKSKQCKKNKLCIYKKDKKCYQNVKNVCVGNNEDTHGRCYKHEDKKTCVEDCQTNVFGKKCFCTWGVNTMDREKDHRACAIREKLGGKNCSTKDDCACGADCVEGMCMLCGDIIGSGACDSLDMCKWSGDDTGICIRKDACKELTFEEDKCKASPVCDFKEGKCVRKVVDKKLCKKLAKKSKKDTADDLAKKGKDCEAVLACQWNSKKGKCSFRKVK